MIEYFEKTPPHSIAQACAEIGKLTGVHLKETQMRGFIKKIGIKHRKVVGIPAKANLEKQQEFHDEALQPL